MSKLASWLTGDLFKSVGGAIDNLFTSDDERLKARNEVFNVLAQKASESDKIQSDIIQSEAKGNFLQRSWRPILMLGFGFVVLYSKFIAPAFNLPNTELEPDFWELLKMGIGGYVIGRSGEKITQQIMTNLNKHKS
jgi:hypothetical protein